MTAGEERREPIKNVANPSTTRSGNHCYIPMRYTGAIKPWILFTGRCRTGVDGQDREKIKKPQKNTERQDKIIHSNYTQSREKINMGILYNAAITANIRNKADELARKGYKINAYIENDTLYITGAGLCYIIPLCFPEDYVVRNMADALRFMENII